MQFQATLWLHVDIHIDRADGFSEFFLRFVSFSIYRFLSKKLSRHLSQMYKRIFHRVTLTSLAKISDYPLLFNNHFYLIEVYHYDNLELYVNIMFKYYNCIQILLCIHILIPCMYIVVTCSIQIWTQIVSDTWI